MPAQTVAIVGYSVEGKVSYEYYRTLGAAVTICDQNTELDLPDGALNQLGEGYLNSLDRFDVVVRTAGMPPHVIVDANPAVASKITTLIDEFLRVCPTRNVIGVTGTKGKGTTSTLIAKMLEAAGKQVFLGGNIGVPPLTFVDQLDAESWVVLELSSFQLMDITHSPHIGICLMIVPEHLNWHADMAEYVEAKSHLFAAQTSNDIAIYFGVNAISREVAAAGAGRKLPFYESPGAWVNGNLITIDGQEVCTTNELKLLGEHNWQNVCAAITAVWQAGVHDIAAIRSVATGFSGLPHRLEKVRTFKSLSFYNDSFAATPDAAIAASSAIQGPKVMIVGGFDRMLPIDHLTKALAANDTVQSALFIGASAQRLAKECRESGYQNFTVSEAKTMPEVVKQAIELAKGESAIVLSPGFPSFDMFKNFEDRGLQFKAAVEAL